MSMLKSTFGQMEISQPSQAYTTILTSMCSTYNCKFFTGSAKLSPVLPPAGIAHHVLQVRDVQNTAGLQRSSRMRANRGNCIDPAVPFL